MLKGARVWQCSPDAPWDFTWRFRRLGNLPRGKAWARLENRPQQGLTDLGSHASASLRFHAQRTGTRRSELRRGQRWRLHCARAAACAALRVACLAAPTGSSEEVGVEVDPSTTVLPLSVAGLSHSRHVMSGDVSTNAVCAQQKCVSGTTRRWERRG